MKDTNNLIEKILNNQGQILRDLDLLKTPETAEDIEKIQQQQTELLENFSEKFGQKLEDHLGFDSEDIEKIQQHQAELSEGKIMSEEIQTDAQIRADWQKIEHSDKPVVIHVDTYYHYLNVLPPMDGKGCFGLGEPYDHTNSGKIITVWCCQRGGLYYGFLGTKTEAEEFYNKM